MTLHIYTHPSFLRHDTGPGHPERIDRIRVLHDLFKEDPFSSLPVIQAREADYEDIVRAHKPDYIDALMAAMPESGYAFADADTVLSPGTEAAAFHAAGAVCQAVDDILSGACDRAFCAVRPPGHHAFPGHAEGFCLFNNIFIGALYAQESGCKKIAIADFDVHHGNGTEAMARLHDGIFFASSHQWPLYPGTGLPENDIPGRIANATLAAGEGSDAFRAAWSQKLLSQIRAFAPDLLMISAGFDAHRDDPLAQINLVEDDYRWITAELKAIQPRIVSVLEGGYDLAALKAGVAAHLSVLLAD